MEYTKNSFIFPDKKKSGPHLFNHSCSPNCETHSYKGHCLFLALRRIFKGEELTIDYSMAPPEKGGNTHPCFCESHFCRGTMHASEEKTKKIDTGAFSREEKIFNKNIMEVSFSEDLPPLKKYPGIIKVRTIYNLYGNFHKKPLNCGDENFPKTKEMRAKIRESGRILKFNKLNFTVWGLADGMIIGKLAV